MWPTFKLFDGHIHRPLIRFLGKRLPPSIPQLPRPHPAAPPDIVSRFNEFSKHDSEPVTSHSSLKSTGHTSSASTSFNEFWEAPARFWAPSRAIDDAEIEAVLSGGASLK